MSHVALSIVAPIKPGRRDELAAALDALPAGDASPLAGVPGLHVGRLTIIERLQDPRGGDEDPLLGPFLFFAADVDPPQDGAIAAIAAACGPWFEACVDCPDPANAHDFRAWLLRHRVRDGWTIMPYAGRTLTEVRGALSLRERLGSFAVQAQGLDPAALRRRFVEEFAAGRGPAGRTDA